MKLFRKSHKKDDPPVDNTTGRHDPKFSGPGADPNLIRDNQPGVNNGPQSGFTPSQHPDPNKADHAGMGVPDPYAKPSKLGGKVQTAIGTVVGSDSLRAKGMEKEREARNLNMQSNELAQAESLEREAQMHRERVMGSSGDRNFTDSNADRRFGH